MDDLSRTFSSSCQCICDGLRCSGKQGKLCCRKTLLTSIKSSSVPYRYLCYTFRSQSTKSVIFAVILFINILCTNICESYPSSSSGAGNQWYRDREVDALDYMGKFGYYGGPGIETGNLMSKEDFTKALKRLQRFGHIPETGVVDQRTLELMQKPRCGVSDNVDEFDSKRRKRYATAPSKWEKKDLTFRILNYSNDLSKTVIRKAITEAFKVWSSVTSLTFTELYHDGQTEADILIQFAVMYHHDGYPFDGKGQVLAHAFFPGDDKGGDTHFDDDEVWAYNSTEDGNVDLFMVAAHEFGHALGLAHSSNTEALMYPWYQGYQNNFRLPYDDVQGIQTLYGGKNPGWDDRPDVRTQKPPIDRDRPPDRPVTQRPDRPSYTVVPPNRPDDDDVVKINPCDHSIDALTVIRKEVFIFAGHEFWRLGVNGMRGRSTEIHKFWYGLPPDGIDAVYERTDGKIVFFKGNRFWVFDSNHMVAGFPKEGKLISELGIDKSVKKVDAAFVWGFNKRTYIITGDMYWKLGTKSDVVEYDYPRDMSIWRNVQVPVDAAFKHWDGKTYFFQGKYYWEYNDNRMRVKKRKPRVIGDFLGCKNGKLPRNFQQTADNTDNNHSVTIKCSLWLLLLTQFLCFYRN